MIIRDIESESSASARAVYMQRAFAAYQSGPHAGDGLDRAHSLLPHNSYLLLAVAFGHYGWLIPAALVGIIIYLSSGIIGYLTALATAAIMFVSHDVLLMPSLVLPVSIALVGILAQRTHSSKCHREGTKGVYSTISIGFALFGIGFVLASKSPNEAWFALHPDYIKRLEGHAYYTALPVFGRSGLNRVDSERLKITEDGLPLIRSSTPASVSIAGEGRFAVWQRQTLLFSALDNTDPRTNFREYRINVPVTHHPLFYLLLLACVICAIALNGVCRNWIYQKD